MNDNYFDALKTKTLKNLENRSKVLAPLNLSKAKRNMLLLILKRLAILQKAKKRFRTIYRL